MWLARDSEGGLLLFISEPVKKKITVNPDFPKYKKTITTWEIPGDNYGYIPIPKRLDTYIWVHFENSPVKVILAPDGYVMQ